MAKKSVPPRIALIHAVAVAIEPVENAFAQRWPQANRFNLLDDSLAPDRAATEELTPEISERIEMLANYAVRTGANGILFTCSAFGSAIESAARNLLVPVLRPNEAMFELALDCGRRVAMLATFAPAVESMESEFRALAAARGIDADIATCCVPEAMTALKAGDGARHDQLLADAATRFNACDAIMLAHFSTARARDAVSQVTAVVPVLTSPDAAVDLMRARLERASS